LTSDRRRGEETLVAGITPLHESNIVVVAALASIIAFVVELVRAVWEMQDQSFMIFHQDFIDTIKWYLCDTWFLLQLAYSIVVVRLAIRRWRRAGEQPPLRVPRFHGWRFVAAVIGLAVVAATGIPALSAFSFASWFAPWSQ
jgi:hypothetical protein